MKAKEFFEQALAIDPNYAPAYGGLALYYYMLVRTRRKTVQRDSALGEIGCGESAGARSLHCEAHSALAIMAAAFDYDWKGAENHYRQALASEPVQPRFRYSYAVYYLLPQGRIPEALAQCRLALETDPLSMFFTGEWFIPCTQRNGTRKQLSARAKPWRSMPTSSKFG